MVRSAPTLLCIDDEETLLKMRALVLQQEGYRVLQATSAEEALRLFSSEPIDLVISDHLLTGTTGSELASTMKLFKPTVPIILLTGCPEPPDATEHVDAVLVKGSGVSELLLTIKSLLRKSKHGVA